MFADPTEPGFLRQGFLENRRAVGIRAHVGIAAAFIDAPRERAQATAHDLVIVATQRVARHVAEVGPFQHLQRLRVGRLIVHPRDDGATAARYEPRRIEAELQAALEIFHLAVSSVGEPSLESLAIDRHVEIGDRDLLEAEFSAPLLDVVCECLERQRKCNRYGALPAL